MSKRKFANSPDSSMGEIDSLVPAMADLSPTEVPTSKDPSTLKELITSLSQNGAEKKGRSYHAITLRFTPEVFQVLEKTRGQASKNDFIANLILFASKQ